jgi:hypothetical protein
MYRHRTVTWETKKLYPSCQVAFDPPASLQAPAIESRKTPRHVEDAGIIVRIHGRDKKNLQKSATGPGRK